MKLTSSALRNGAPIPATFAAGDANGFAANRNPPLAWSEVPEGTRSFALLCIDPDVPTVPETVGRSDCSVPVDQPRALGLQPSSNVLTMNCAAWVTYSQNWASCSGVRPASSRAARKWVSQCWAAVGVTAKGAWRIRIDLKDER